MRNELSFWQAAGAFVGLVGLCLVWWAVLAFAIVAGSYQWIKEKLTWK